MTWLDAYRGLAVVAMIWVHAANTFLTRDLQASAGFGQMTFYHGLIAPAFFWIAGFVRGVRAQTAPSPGWPAVRRLLGVMALGYALRFPLLPLLTGTMTPADWAEMVKVDVLQTLAATGLSMVAVERWCPRGAAQATAMTVLTAAFVILTGPASTWATGLPWLDAWLNRGTGSVFSLFPWVGFGLAGWLCGALAGGTHLRQMACCGALLAWVLPHGAWAPEEVLFFLQRLGWVLVGAWAVAAGTGLMQHCLGGLLLAGRQSLIMYVAHLLMIHAIPLPWQTLDKSLAHQLTLPLTLAAFAVLLALSWALAWGNEARVRRVADRSGG